MAKLEMYYKPACPFCKKAKALLDSKSVVINYVNIIVEPEKRTEMIERSFGKQTVPQIFIDGQHIGGCDDLYKLESQGKLDSLLK